MTKVDVCICAYRRASIGETLSSVARQQLDHAELRVIVADNDEHAGRRREIDLWGKQLGLSLQYVHAPARNISIARNACLDAATADWIAFIDDDEIADESWLANLLSRNSERDIVFGLVKAEYPPGTPDWMVEGDFHSTSLQASDPLWNGHTGNALIRRSFVKGAGLRFAQVQGRTGGEDTLFFFEAMEAGARFGYAPGAVVTEFTDASRTSLRWLLSRRFRSGQTHHVILQRQGKSVSGALLAAPKLAYSLAAAAASATRPPRAMRHLLRGGLHAGVIAAAIGLAPYQEYGRGNPRP